MDGSGVLPDDSPPGAGPASRPVFVDASGRRGRWVRRGGRALTSLLVGYLLLVVAALVGPSQLSALRVPGLGPVLPGPGAAGLGDGTGARQNPQAVLDPTTGPSRSPAPRVSRAPTVRTSSAPTRSQPTPAATAPGRSGVAPGQSASPSASVTPSATPSPAPTRGPPRSSRAPSPRPKPSRPTG